MLRCYKGVWRLFRGKNRRRGGREQREAAGTCQHSGCGWSPHPCPCPHNGHGAQPGLGGAIGATPGSGHRDTAGGTPEAAGAVLVFPPRIRVGSRG